MLEGKVIMREWLTPICLVVAFTAAVALAGSTVRELSLWADGDAAAIFRPDPGITLEELAQARDLPTSKKTWTECCSHEDCKEAQISVRRQNDEWTLIKINDMEPFHIETSKVRNSLNGKAYYCRISPFHRLDRKNIRCVFVVGRLA